MNAQLETQDTEVRGHIREDRRRSERGLRSFAGEERGRTRRCNRAAGRREGISHARARSYRRGPRESRTAPARQVPSSKAEADAITLAGDAEGAEAKIAEAEEAANAARRKDRAATAPRCRGSKRSIARGRPSLGALSSGMRNCNRSSGPASTDSSLNCSTSRATKDPIRTATD